MNLGGAELGILGLLALFLLGGGLKSLKRTKQPDVAPKSETDPNANFQKLNTNHVEGATQSYPPPRKPKNV